VPKTGAALKRAYPDRSFAVAGLASPEAQQRFEAAGIPCFTEATHATRAIGAGADFAAAFARPLSWRPLAGSAQLAPGPYTEVEAMTLLAETGLPMVPHRLARSADEAVEAAAALGFPVVAKIVSPDILHKTDIGGVKLNLADAKAVGDAFDAIMAAAKKAQPDAKLDGIMIAPMVKGGVECIIGVHRDPVFGPTVLVGLGGVLVEVLKDVSFRVAPFGVDEAHRMIREVKGYPLLQGARGQPPADLEALAEALALLSVFAHGNRESVAGVDLNPFLVRPKGQGAVALDALVQPKLV